ncbi:MAG: tetratricopeptide repeat protein [Alphaproteobacteria bacterium]
MKKIIVCLICLNMLSAPCFAQEMDLLSNDLALADNQTADSSQENSAEEQSEDKTSSWFGFITRPLSSLFSSNEDVTVASAGDAEKKETPLEKSTRMAEDGSLEDQMDLAYMYLYGTNGVAQNYEKAFKYYSMAAKQDDPIALNNLGSLYFNGIGTERNIKTALTLFERASDLGNDNASINLGFILLKGGTKDTKRNKKAMELFKKAQQEGNKIAQFMVGYAYYVGFVFPQDYAKAFPLIRASATGEAQIDEAQLILTDMYIKGYGTTQNYQSAVNALRQASIQGNLDAILSLADHYTSGDIGIKNPIMAHTLYNLAAANNITQAAKIRDELGKKLRPEEIALAQKNAQEYKAQPSELTTYIRQTYGTSLRYYIDNNIPLAKEAE